MGGGSTGSDPYYRRLIPSTLASVAPARLVIPSLFSLLALPPPAALSSSKHPPTTAFPTSIACHRHDRFSPDLTAKTTADTLRLLPTHVLTLLRDAHPSFRPAHRATSTLPHQSQSGRASSHTRTPTLCLCVAPRIPTITKQHTAVPQRAKPNTEPGASYNPTRCCYRPPSPATRRNRRGSSPRSSSHRPRALPNSCPARPPSATSSTHAATYTTSSARRSRTSPCPA